MVFYMKMKKQMKGAAKIGLLGGLALAGCQTAHDAAVTSFRVLDAPAAYIRRHIDASEEPQTTTTATTTSGASNTTIARGTTTPTGASEHTTSSPPPVTNERSVTAEKHASTPPVGTSQTGHENASINPKPSPTQQTVSSQMQFPYGKPVPGKPGYVYSPFDRNGGYVDVTGYSPGSKVKDPYTGKIFLVP